MGACVAGFQADSPETSTQFICWKKSKAGVFKSYWSTSGAAPAVKGQACLATEEAPFRVCDRQ